MPDPVVFDIFGGEKGELAEMLLTLLNKNVEQSRANLANVIAKYASGLWKNEAVESSRSGWGYKYAESIRIEPATENNPFAKVYAAEDETDERTGKPYGLFVNIVEDGIKSWSIRDALLASDKVKISKSGNRYIHVPFRYRTPGAQKPSVSFAGVMPDEIYNVVKGGKMRLSGEEHGRKAGLAKISKPGQSAYFTFRTVSEKSTAKNAWQYPQKPPTPVFARVQKKVQAMIDTVLDTYCKALVEEVKKAT